MINLCVGLQGTLRMPRLALLLFMVTVSNLTWILHFHTTNLFFSTPPESTPSLKSISYPIGKFETREKLTNAASAFKHKHESREESKPLLRNPMGNIKMSMLLRLYNAKTEFKDFNVSNYTTTGALENERTRKTQKYKNNKDIFTNLQIPQEKSDIQSISNYLQPVSSNSSQLQPSTPHCHSNINISIETLVPRIVHVMWLQPAKTIFHFHQLVCLLSVQRFLQPRKVLFWHDGLPVGTWWLFARQSIAHLLLVPLQPPTRLFNTSIPKEDQENVARMQVLYEHGGLSIDLDVVVVKPLLPLLHQPLTTAAPPAGKLTFTLVEKLSRSVQGWLQGYARGSANVGFTGSCEVDISAPECLGSLNAKGKSWRWKDKYAVHLCIESDRSIHYDPRSIRSLNTTTAELFRYIYYPDPSIMLE